MMRNGRGHAWLTYVTKSDESIMMALILAESLRNCKTTKRIGIIASSNVDTQKTQKLAKVFDDILLLNDNLIPETNMLVKEERFRERDTELRAKIFAFSLEMYEKVVLLSPNHIVLENCDNIFEGQLLTNMFKGQCDNMFHFTPNRNVFQFLKSRYESQSTLENLGKNFVVNCLRQWIKNNEINGLSMETVDQDTNVVAKFSMKTGKLLLSGISFNELAIVQFVDIDFLDTDLVTRMESLLKANRNIGLLDKVIITKWFDIYQHQYGTGLDPILNGVEDETYDREPIAIIGMSCRFPGANNLEEFWSLLHGGLEGIDIPPSFRWGKEHSISGCSNKERETRAGFLAVPVDEFDAKFFGISPKEATFLDPQARLLHELVWECLENSGIDSHSLHGSHTGIFTGSWMNDYKDIVQSSTEKEFFRTYMGNSMGSSAARLSFLLGTTGPSIATESGCSSAIVAVDLAVKSLRNGESSLAIASGVNLLLHPFKSDIIDYVISPDGRCKTFDASANGFARAEGCGVLVLKRMSDALRDRDNIWALIRGSAISQEGMSRSLGTPTVHCEALVMKLALEDAGVLPEQVSFVESHGTGTSVGDPMEIEAITETYGYVKRTSPLVIGSVKTNVGHTESCSGITGIIKTVLSMQHEVIPKHLNLETINPHIKLDVIPATIPLEPKPWPKSQGVPRLAGVSSFGITGTDGHVILQESPDYQLPKIDMGLERPLHIMKLSAKTAESLDKLIDSYENYFGRDSQTLQFQDAAFTANTGRASFNHRAFVLASSLEHAKLILHDKTLIKGEIVGTSPGICFLFTGQGSQYTCMARSLYDSSPVFRAHFDYCEHTLKSEYDLSIVDAIWSLRSESFVDLNRTLFSQTSIFCIEYCLLKLWESWGIKPDYVLGHSLGEFCAAVAANILSFEDALKLVVTRSRLIDQLETGSMLVIKASLNDVEKLLESTNIALDIAAVNSSEQTVVAGSTGEILQLMEYCTSNTIKSVKLEATHAFHSRYMDPILNEYQKVAETIRTPNCSSGCQFISGMNGKLIENPNKEINAEYWVNHTRNRVSFLDACMVIQKLGCQNFLEIGPQPVLSTFIMQNIERSQPINCYPSIRRMASDWETILTSLGKLYLKGYPIDWAGFDKPYNRKKIASLPTYSFQRKSYWVDCMNTNVTPIHPLIGHPIWNASSSKIFENNLSLRSASYLKDHCIGNRVVIPAAAFAEMCLSAGYSVTNSIKDNWRIPTFAHPMTLENLSIMAPLELKEGSLCHVQVIVDLPVQADSNSKEKLKKGLQVKVFHQSSSTGDTNAKWILHASANFHSVSTTGTFTASNNERIAELMQGQELPIMNGFYKRISELGLKFGDTFKSIQRHWRMEHGNGNDEVVVEIKVPFDSDRYIVHPVIIDAMFQTAILTQIKSQSETLRVPVRIGQLTWLSNVDQGDNSILYIYAWWNRDGKLCIMTYNESLTTPIAYLTDLEMVETNVKTIESILEQQNNLLPDFWEEVWKPISGPHDNRAVLAPMEPVLSSDKFTKELEAASILKPGDWNRFNRINRLIFLYMLQTLAKLGWNPSLGQKVVVSELCTSLSILPEYHNLVKFYLSVFRDEQFVDYMEREDKWQVKRVLPDTLELETEIQCIENEFVNEESLTLSVKFYHNLAHDLTQILTGNESPLQILFPTDPEKEDYTAEKYYQYHPGRPDTYSKLLLIYKAVFQKYREMSGDASSKMLRILEVGAGTGSITQFCILRIKENWGDNFEYFYTDISPAFFPKAEVKLAEFKRNLNFTVYNIEENPLTQGIPLNYFDMVVAQDVLHVTKNLHQTAKYLSSVLRPGGSFICTEVITQDRGVTFTFGLLEGYWRFEDFELRKTHPCIGGKEWKTVLNESGFDYVHKTEAYYETIGTFYGETPLAANTETSLHSHSQYVIQETISDKKSHWCILCTKENSVVMANVCDRLQRCENKVTIICSDEFTEMSKLDKILAQGEILTGIIYAGGLLNPTNDQKTIAQPLLYIIKKIIDLKKPPKLYVFTNGVHAINADINLINDPFAATLFGMVKSLKNENSELFVRYVDLENTNRPALVTEQILYELAMHKETTERDRVQIAYRDGQRYEPKFTKSNMLKHHKSKNQLQLPLFSEMYHLMLPESKMIEDLKFVVLEKEHVFEGQVELRVEAYALNFRDIVTVLKPTAEFEKLSCVGLDFAGVVTEVGPGVNEECFQVGDRVFGVNYKNYTALRSHLVLNTDHLVKIPREMTFTEASTLPAVFITSLHCLVNVAKLKAGETVLIHTGSGGVGLSAIQIAKIIGARIITTAGNERKRGYLRSLGIEHVFHSRNASFAEKIMKVTNGRGVDVVLNSITGPGLKEATLSVSAKGCRFVEMSKLSIWTEEEVKKMRPDVKYTIEDLTVLEREIWVKLLETINKYLNEGVVKPLPHVTFGALHVRQALAYFLRASHIGKVVVRMARSTTKNGEWVTSVPLFNGDSTYIITGGFGGIGFEVCKWMLENGATDIVLIGRNPPKPDVAEAIRKLQINKQCKILIKLGNVGDHDQCQDIIKNLIKSGSKPIRGIHHCAGALNDNLYPDQTWENFEDTFESKIKGTWNLHKLTREMPLEHFVLYSSISAITSPPKQSNHAAANCFEDAFAHYRYSLGLPAVSINWGQWSQVGCAKEMNLPGLQPLSVQQALNGLEVALQTQKVQMAIANFDSLETIGTICPTFRHELDERLLRIDNKQVSFILPTSDQFWNEINAVDSTKEKTEVVSGYISVIVRGALRMHPNENISADANMQELGVDSLMAIELKNSIQSLLGSRLTITVALLKNCTTIRELATVVVAKICDREDDCMEEEHTLTPEELEGLITSDCLLDEDIQSPSDELPCVTSMRTVLITGVTGQLGPYILSQLSTGQDYQSLTKIVCLIRTRDGKCPKEKLARILDSMNLSEKVDMNKIDCVRNDLTLPNFGLEMNTYEQLCADVDGVIHLAVKSNHLEPYRKVENGNTDVRSVNVGGTLNVLRFAATTKTKYVYHAGSILSVFGKSDDGGLCDDWPENDQVAGVISSQVTGYPTSKYICEMLMKQAVDRGIPCKVFRFPWITGESETGQLNYARNHYILRFLSYLKIKMMPDAPIPALVLPVDFCANLSLKLFWNDETPNEVFNITHPNPQLEVEFIKVAREDFGVELELVDWKNKEFVEKLYDSNMPLEPLKDIYADVNKFIAASQSEALQAIQGYLIKPDNFFSNRKVEKYVPDFSINLPNSMHIIKRNIEFVRSKGCFDKFGIDK